MKTIKEQRVSVLRGVDTVEIPITLITQGTLVKKALFRMRGESVNIQWVAFPSQVMHPLLTEILTIANVIAQEEGKKGIDITAALSDNSV